MNTKLSYVRFHIPADIDGLGCTDRIDTRPDPESGRPRLMGVTMTWLAQERVLRVTTAAGATWVFESNLASAKPVYEDLVKAAKAAKK